MKVGLDHVPHTTLLGVILRTPPSYLRGTHDSWESLEMGLKGHKGDVGIVTS